MTKIGKGSSLIYMYACPMHPEIHQSSPGSCSVCGMRLTNSKDVSSHTPEETSYKPLFIIIGLILIVTFSLSVKRLIMQQFSLELLLMDLMAGFFLVFSGFKLLDIKGFAEGYSTYDLLARRIYSYGYVYPFLELSLGIFYALHLNIFFVTIFTIFLMTFSGVGVALKLIKKEKFQCACLGTFLKVPLTKVTLVEDFGMASMGLLMLLL